VTGGLACEEMYYELRHGRAVKLEAIAIRIGAVVREESRENVIEGTKWITRVVQLTRYLERDWARLTLRVSQPPFHEDSMASQVRSAWCGRGVSNLRLGAHLFLRPYILRHSDMLLNCTSALPKNRPATLPIASDSDVISREFTSIHVL